MKYLNKIDFQAHYLPKTYYDFLESEGLSCPDGFPTLGVSHHSGRLG